MRHHPPTDTLHRSYASTTISLLSLYNPVLPVCSCVFKPSYIDLRSGLFLRTMRNSSPPLSHISDHSALSLFIFSRAYLMPFRASSVLVLDRFSLLKPFSHFTRRPPVSCAGLSMDLHRFRARQCLKFPGCEFAAFENRTCSQSPRNTALCNPYTHAFLRRSCLCSNMRGVFCIATNNELILINHL